MRRAVLFVALLLATGSSGCTQMFVAHVPASYWGQDWTENTAKADQEKRGAGFGLSRAARVYETQADASGPPGQMVVTTIRILGGASRSALFERLDDGVRTHLTDEGIELDESSRREGERTLGQAQPTLYFTYSGKSGSSGFFGADREVRVLGEVFNDDASDVTVLIVGLAQVTGDSLLTGGRDTTSWGRIVADLDGSIESIQGSDGLAYRVVSHA